MKIVLEKAELIISLFYELFYAVINHEYTHYILKGGRGSTKSSFVALMILLLIILNPKTHALCMRKIGNTIQKSIRAQIEWWIYRLDLQDFFIIPKVYGNPIIYKPTGQQIIFAGLDDPQKIKSIKVPFGYIGITWFEEFDQYNEEEVRNVLQSIMRGGDKFWNFASFNPPISKNNWANKYAEEAKQKANTTVISSCYLDVPRDWLGDAFFEEAENLKALNPRAYQHEYMGEATGTGGDVFENIEALDMSEVIPIQWDANGKVLKSVPRADSFDNIICGIDWGFAVDPFRFVKCHYDRRRHDLYIFSEYSTVQKRNQEVFADLFDIHHLVTKNDLITADSAEPKSIADFHAYGARIRGAEKGADSVRYGIQWLQGLHKIYIDADKCPKTYQEFIGYEYPRDKNGDFMSVYPDKNNHSIDAIRYATESIWKRRGA